MIHTREVAVPG